MSRYLQSLTMRSVGEGNGLSPRPLGRYETVQPSHPAELTESTEEQIGMKASLENEHSIQNISPWISLSPADVSHVGNGGVRGKGTDGKSPDEVGREVIGKRQHKQSGINGEESSEGEAVNEVQTGAVRPPAVLTQASRESSRLLSEHHQISVKGTPEIVPSVSRLDAPTPDCREVRTATSGQWPGSLTSDRAGQAAAEEGPSSLVKTQERLRELLRPILEQGAFQQRCREATGPPIKAQPSVVNIRIGRIEVRAIAPPISASSKKLVETPRSSMPLDQYLKRRSQEA